MAARRSVTVSLLGRALIFMGAFLLVVPIVVPVRSWGTLDEFELRCLMLVQAVAFCGVGVAIERRIFAGFLLYVAGSTLSLLWHLAHFSLHGLGLAMVDAGFLGLLVLHRAEFHRGL